MSPEDNPHQRLKPSLTVVVTAWPHESVIDLAAGLVDIVSRVIPGGDVELTVCPQRLVNEADIPCIVQYFADCAPDALCIIPGNVTLDNVIPLLVETMKLPTVLWGFPTREAWGALVAVQQTSYCLKELGLPFCFVAGRLDPWEVWESVLIYVCVAALIKPLNGARIEPLGWSALGTSDVVFDELAIHKTFGVQLVNIWLTAYARALQDVSENEVDPERCEIWASFNTTEMHDKARRYGIRSHLALKNFVDQQNLQAFTLECSHDQLGGPCPRFCLLNDQGVTATCQNYIPASVLMTAAQKLSGKKTFQTAIVEADSTYNRAILHPFGNLTLSLVKAGEQPGMKPIRETASRGAFGSKILLKIKPGPVTIANLVNGQEILG